MEQNSGCGELGRAGLVESNLGTVRVWGVCVRESALEATWGVVIRKLERAGADLHASRCSNPGVRMTERPKTHLPYVATAARKATQSQSLRRSTPLWAPFRAHRELAVMNAACARARHCSEILTIHAPSLGTEHGRPCDVQSMPRSQFA